MITPVVQMTETADEWSYALAVALEDLADYARAHGCDEDDWQSRAEDAWYRGESDD